MSLRPDFRPSLRLLPTPDPRPDLLDLLHDFVNDREGRPTPLAPQDQTDPAPADRIPPGAA